jgi:hypothetical protein
MSVESASAATPANLDTWGGRHAGWEKPAAEQTLTIGWAGARLAAARFAGASFVGVRGVDTAGTGRTIRILTTSQIRRSATPTCLRKVC